MVTARTVMGCDGRAGMLLSLFISAGVLPVSTHLHFLTRWSPGSCSSYMVSQGFKCKSLREKGRNSITCISLPQMHRVTPIRFHWLQISHKSSQTQVQIYLNKDRENFKNIWTGIYLGTMVDRTIYHGAQSTNKLEKNNYRQLSLWYILWKTLENCCFHQFETKFTHRS